MATTQTRRTGSEQSAAPVPFSYAMAAKGLSSTGPSTAAQSKAASGSSTPSKDTNSASTVPPVASVTSWADDTEAEHGKNEKPIQMQEDRPNVPPPSDPNTDNLPPPTSAVSSPDLGASSASTAVKEDDASSLQNALSESAWENKSQASTSVEKTSESGEKAEKLPVKPLYEAPVPAVNIWTKRLEDQKKVAPKPSGTKLPNTVVSNGSSQGPSAFATKKTKGSDGVDVKEKATSVEGKFKSRDQERDSQPRREFGSGGDFDKTRKGSKGRSLEKDVKPAPAVLPLPPTRDQESWPTPDSAIDEDKKKTQDKVEKLEKERKDGAPSKPHSKWVSVPFTPTVIFNTPLPNAAASRRGGGRVGGRGGGANSGRGNGFGSNSVTSPEKDASTPSTLMNGDQPKRGRSDESTTRDASPGEKRPTSTGSTSLKEAKGLHSGAERSAKTGVAPETDPPSGRGTVLADTSSNTTGQNNSFPRQYPSGKPNKGRRGDIRKDGEIFSPTKENAGSHDRRTSTATQANDLDDHERRAPAFQDGQAASSKSGPNERRFSSLSGRDRGGRGGRGGRAGYQNGHHQFANGHAPPIQSSSTFPLARSPTNFQPEQGAYFPAPSGHGRNHRNGPRSQSVTNDNIYGRGSYGGHQQVPPIQTYNAPPVYDYGMMPPMNSAMPFSPFPVDQWTLLQLVSTQMEYYFSVENLCKDIFLRKHMDSQGFVFLSVLAGFNRIKQLTTDLDILKQVCHNSRTIEYLIGADGKDRLRKREDWKQWVMAVKERDVSAQNDGPEELHSPPVPHPLTFEQPPMHRYPDMSAGSPTGPVPFQPMNGFHPGDGPDAVALDHPLNGHANGVNGVNGVNGFNGPNGQVNGINGYIGSNGHPIEATTNNA